MKVRILQLPPKDPKKRFAEFIVQKRTFLFFWFWWTNVSERFDDLDAAQKWVWMEKTKMELDRVHNEVVNLGLEQPKAIKREVIEVYEI